MRRVSQLAVVRNDRDDSIDRAIAERLGLMSDAMAGTQSSLVTKQNRDRKLFVLLMAGLAVVNVITAVVF